MQVLEGFADELNETFQRICRNPPHHPVHLLHCHRDRHPQFLHPLAYVEATPASAAILARYEAVAGLLMPERLADADALAMMADLQEIAVRA